MIETRLVNLAEDLLIIPSLAIHMQRDVNTGHNFNPAVDLQPLYGPEGALPLRSLLAQRLDVAPDDLLAADLNLVPRQKAVRLGPEGEYLAAPRIDDLECAWATLLGFLSGPEDSPAAWCLLDHEEVGSGSRQGAQSDFVQAVLTRAILAQGGDAQHAAQAVAGSFALSADNAHARHPNFPEVSDKTANVVLNGGVLLKYSAKNKKWSEILLTSLRLHCPGLGSVLKEGDTVTVSGMPGTVCSAAAAGLNGEVSISTLDGDDVITTLAVPEDSTRYYGSWTVTATGTSWRSADGKVTENEAAAAPVKLERRVPDLDFVTEQGNRVWGCSREENSIYACALGDPTNWYSYRGIASDSYAVSVGSDGAFTGAASCLGYLLFFKENCIHKLYGSKPSDYQMSSVRCRGVAENAAKSLCVIAETLYYLSPDGVMAWSGSLPAKVSGALDTGKLTAVERAVGGQLDARYYLYLHRKMDTGSGRLLVYDTERGLWQEESAAGTGMVSTGQQLYLWDGNALWAADPEREVSGEDETGLKFEAVTGDIGLAVPDDKYISRVTLRMDALAHTVLTVAVSYDGGDWETVSSCAVTRDHQRVNLPFVPRRHDTMRLRFAGTGQMVLRSMAFTFADAAGARVSGAVPRR